MPSEKKVNCEECQDTGVYDYHGFSMDICMKCNGNLTVKPNLTVEPVSKPYKLDWTDQWDDCDLCECCGNLVSGGQLFNRLSLAVTTLYTHGALTPTQRDAVRSKLKNLAA